MKRSEKIFFVDNLAEKIKAAKLAALVDYTNLKAGQMSEVRDALREVTGVEFLVVKNSLFKKALQMVGLALRGEFEKKLEGQSALVISNEDEVAGLSVLAKLAGQMGSLRFKLGVMGERLLDGTRVGVLANLPPKNVLYGNLVNLMTGPVSGLVYVLNGNLSKLVRLLKAISEKKGGEAN